jgi:hypothetical protein
MPNFFQAMGQSNINQSLGQTLQYLQSERANQLAEKRMGMEEQQLTSTLETNRLQRNMLETQIADAQKLREKVNVQQIMDSFPFKDGESAAFLMRSAKMQGFIDPDGFTTKGDLQKFGEFLKSPETQKTLNKLIVNDADANVAKLKGLSENPDALKESGMKPDELQQRLQQAYAMQAKVHTAYSNQEDAEKLFDNFPAEIKALASAEGIDPTRVRDPARLAAMMGTNIPRWRQQIINEHVQAQKSAAMATPNWAWVTGADGQPKKVNLDTYQLQPGEKPYAAGSADSFKEAAFKEWQTTHPKGTRIEFQREYEPPKQFAQTNAKEDNLRQAYAMKIKLITDPLTGGPVEGKEGEHSRIMSEFLEDVAEVQQGREPKHLKAGSSPAGITEGTIIVNPATKERMEMKGGKWVQIK